MIHLFEVQGSYLYQPKDRDKPYRSNLRAFVLAETLEEAIDRYREHLSPYEDVAVHQAIMRTSANVLLLGAES